MTGRVEEDIFNFDAAHWCTLRSSELNLLEIASFLPRDLSLSFSDSYIYFLYQIFASGIVESVSDLIPISLRFCFSANYIPSLPNHGYSCC